MSFLLLQLIVGPTMGLIASWELLMRSIAHQGSTPGVRQIWLWKTLQVRNNPQENALFSCSQIRETSCGCS